MAFLTALPLGNDRHYLVLLITTSLLEGQWSAFIVVGSFSHRCLTCLHSQSKPNWFLKPTNNVTDFKERQLVA